MSKNYYATIRAGSTSILVVGLHFLAQPENHDRLHQRQAQARVIRAVALEKRCSGCEVIILGDFNDFDPAPDSKDHKDSEPITTVLTEIRGMDPGQPDDNLQNVASKVGKADRYTAHWDQDADNEVDAPHELGSIDHILVSDGLYSKIDSVYIDHSVDPILETDHFPIIVAFDLGGGTTPAGGTPRIESLLPNPEGDEDQNEKATIMNIGSQPVDMTGWTLRDRAERTWTLDSLGTVAPGVSKTIQRLGQPMAMNNRGDTIELVNPQGDVVQTFTYPRVEEGEEIFPS